MLVTHDQDEALALADQVALLSDGRMLASAEPRQLYSDPPDVRTAASIGEANILAAEVRDGRAICSLGSISVISEGELPRDGPAQLLLRPEQLALRRRDADDTTRARVTDVQYHGHDAFASRCRSRTAMRSWPGCSGTTSSFPGGTCGSRSSEPRSAGRARGRAAPMHRRSHEH